MKAAAAQFRGNQKSNEFGYNEALQMDIVLFIKESLREERALLFGFPHHYILKRQVDRKIFKLNFRK